MFKSAFGAMVIAIIVFVIVATIVVAIISSIWGVVGIFLVNLMYLFLSF
ncbi:hypothetical protein VN1202_02380 [Helicobacter pylori]|nr:hypothetical protein VN1202_02380 [Helicobacter pylori]